MRECNNQTYANKIKVAHGRTPPVEEPPPGLAFNV
jgi:hypothetical protein